MLAPRRNESPMQYWISLWPTAPMFGVKWRFEGMNPAMAFFNPPKVAGEVARASAQEAARAVEDAAQAAEAQAAAAAREKVATTAAEPTADAAATPEAGVETLEAAADATEATADAVETLAEVDADDAGASGPTPPAGLYAAPPALIDDLKQIKGVGPKLEMALNDLGVYRFEQIVAFTEADLAWLDEQLSSFRMRPQGSDLVAQAKAFS